MPASPLRIFKSRAFHRTFFTEICDYPFGAPKIVCRYLPTFMAMTILLLKRFASPTAQSGSWMMCLPWYRLARMQTTCYMAVSKMMLSMALMAMMRFMDSPAMMLLMEVLVMISLVRRSKISPFQILKMRVTITLWAVRAMIHSMAALVMTSSKVVRALTGSLLARATTLSMADRATISSSLMCTSTLKTLNATYMVVVTGTTIFLALDLLMLRELMPMYWNSRRESVSMTCA